MNGFTWSGAPGDGVNAFILDDPPDWNSPFEVTAQLPTSMELALNGLEARSQLGDTLRLSVKYSVTLEGEAASLLRIAMAALNVQPVLCPLWPAAVAPGATPLIASEWYLPYDIDNGELPIIPASALAAQTINCYPLMVGKLQKIADPQMLAQDVLTLTFEFVENSASTILTWPAFAPATSVAAANGPRPIWPWRADWAIAPKGGAAEVQIESQQIGQGRVLSDAYYNQTGRRRSVQNFTLTDTDIWDLLSFFAQVGNLTENFWLPTELDMGIGLVNDANAGDATITVQPDSIPGEDFIDDFFFILDDLDSRQLVKLTGGSGSPLVMNISPALANAFAATETRITPAMLARLDETKITVSFAAADVATVQLHFKEVPMELAGASAETIGTTMGPLVMRAWLYVFTVKYPGATQTWYFTSFERQLTDASENNYLPQPFENEPITETATIERQSVSIKSRNFTGNPLALMVPFDLEWPLLIQIYEADVAVNAVSNLRCYFNGEVTRCETDGPFLTATAQSLNSLFDRQIPRRLFQNGCNWILFESKCGIVQSAWTWTGTLTGYNADTLTLTIGSVASANAAALAAHFFAGGFLTVGAGTAQQYRMIVDSTAVGGGSLQLVLATPFNAIPANGSVVTFFPACDGIVTTCKNKFNNYQNFGGFPFIPAANPSMFQTTEAAYGGGKK